MVDGISEGRGEQMNLKPVEIRSANSFENIHGEKYIGKFWIDEGMFNWVTPDNRVWRASPMNSAAFGGAEKRQEEVELFGRTLKEAGYTWTEIPVYGEAFETKAA